MSDFTLPTSRVITQEWAQDFMWLNGVYYPNGFYSSLGWKGHNGIDYGCWVGDEVEAVCDGVIEYVGPGNHHPLLSGGGNTILLRSDKYRMRFEYLHLSQQNVYTGQQVTKGQVIGLSGNTGVSTAPHLHLGAIPVGPVNQNDGWRGRVDPTPYLYGGGIAAQGSTTPTTTPIQEDEMSAAEVAAIRGDLNTVHEAVKQVERAVRGDLHSVHESVLSNSVTKPETLSAIAKAVLTRPGPMRDPSTKTNGITGTTTPETKFEWMAYNFEEARQDAARTRERVAAVESKLDKILALLAPAEAAEETK